MLETRHVGNCRWSHLTLFLEFPVWMESEVRPWSCGRLGNPEPLDTTEVCRRCPEWQPICRGGRSQRSPVN